MADIEIKRGYEVLPDNRVRFGIRVINNGDTAISEVEVILDYSHSLFQLEGSKIEELGTIPPSIPRTAKFILKPLGCVHKEEIGATVFFRDSKWEKHTLEMPPKEIHCVCPFLKEKSITRSDFLKLSDEGHSAEHGLNFENITLEKLVEFLSHTCKNRLYKVDEFSIENGKVLYLAGESLGEKAYYLLTAVVIDREEIVQVLLHASSDKSFGIHGFLNEILGNLRHLVQSVSSAREIGIIKNEQVINIIDSVVQHTNFAGGTDAPSVTVQGSVVQRTNFEPSEDEKRKKEAEEKLRKQQEEERLRKEREEQERLRRQQEEEVRLKKAEEERLRRQKEEAERLEETKRKVQEEADKRKKEQERKQQEELPRKIDEDRKKIDEERKKIDEDRKKRDEERKKIDEDRKKRDEDRKKRDEKHQHKQKGAEAQLNQEIEELCRQREEEERKKKEKEAQERKNPEEEKARTEREEQERLRKQKKETERRAREELERRKLEDARKTQAAKRETKPPTQQRVPPKKPGSSSGKGILVFSLIFGILVIGAAVAFYGLNGDSGDSPQEIRPVSATASDNNVEDAPETIANSAQTSSSQNSDTYTNSIGMEFVKIPSGEFMMGSPSEEYYRAGDEGPVHKVTIEESFYLGKFEVTQEQWREVMGSNPSYFEGDDLPVELVSWNDVQEFIEKLNEMEGTNKYRLPSEAEWEYACRAGTTTAYYFGNARSYLGTYAWYDDNSWHKTRLVGQKEPNPWGLYDMHGNVWEWVQDKYHDNYEGAPSDGSAWESGSSFNRVTRGGGWFGNAGICRSANRGRSSPDRCAQVFGFRVLRKL